MILKSDDINECNINGNANPKCRKVRVNNGVWFKNDRVQIKELDIPICQR